MCNSESLVIMDNNNISKEYEAADPLIRKNIRHSLEHTLSVLYDLILLLIICVPVTLWTIVRWFFPLAQKDISGNLALVSITIIQYSQAQSQNLLNTLICMLVVSHTDAKAALIYICITYT